VDQNVQAAQLETEKELKQIDQDILNNKDKVIKKLLEMVSNCKPEIHPNVLFSQ
jgi:hypothetical protein